MRSYLWQLLPRSLLGRLSLVMVVGVLVTQVVGSLFWAAQSHAKSEAESKLAAQYIAHSASASIRFFRELPPNYRKLLIQQFREMGGTRFLVNLNHAVVPVQKIPVQTLVKTVLTTVEATLKTDFPPSQKFELAFAS
ncbi:MAG: hypothetical protein K2P84_08635 [Undibacterium sp.]|nr:hypothetical protein [Undibacterium sp.]